MSTSSSGSSSSVEMNKCHNVRINFENGEKDKDVIIRYAGVVVVIDAIQGSHP